MAEVISGLLGAALLGVVWFVVHYRGLLRKIAALEARLVAMEEAARKRMPYAVQEEVLDALSVLDHLDMDIDTFTAIKENVRAHLAKALSIGTRREK